MFVKALRPYGQRADARTGGASRLHTTLLGVESNGEWSGGSAIRGDDGARGVASTQIDRALYRMNGGPTGAFATMEQIENTYMASGTDLPRVEAPKGKGPDPTVK